MLRLVNVSKSFAGKEVLHPLNFTFQNGVYGLLGPNGAGKTTLINMLVAMSEPSTGSVSYKGKDVFQENMAYYSELGFLPQQDALYPTMKAREYLRYIARLKGIPKADIDERINYLAGLCNLSDELDKRCGKYSGGMKRRLGLMQAMLNDPKVLILDEPTSGLDPMERIRLRNLIADLSLDRTVIFSTHIVPDVEQVANQIIFLKEGTVIACGNLSSFTERMRGKVWEIRVKERDLTAFQQTYAIVSFRTDENAFLLVRFLSDSPPRGASLKEATLEDAFVADFPLEIGGV